MRAIGSWLQWATSKATRPPSWTSPILACVVILGAIAWMNVRSESMPERRLDGFNVIATAAASVRQRVGKAGACQGQGTRRPRGRGHSVPWQPSSASPDLVRGKDMNDDELRAAIRDAHMLGLAVLVKPHVWVPQSWAGAIAMHSAADWQQWFANYQHEITHIAQIAEEEKAEALTIGTELSQTTQLPEWNDLIAKTRAAFSGRLLYVAHNVEEAETVPFWDRLDAIGVSLYPPLGGDDDRDYRRAAMRAIADRLDMLARDLQKTGRGRRDRACARPQAPRQNRGKARRSARRRPIRRFRPTCSPIGSTSRSSDDQRRPDLALVHRSQCRRIDRHRFHRAGQTGGTRSAVRLDTKLRPRLKAAAL